MAASTIEYYPAATLAHVGDSLSRTPKTGDVLRSHPTFQTIELRRAASGVPEVHDRWTDVMMFQSGRAAVLLGGRVTGSQVTTPGEHRGGTIAGGHPQPVGPGDMLVIPAGTPHQIQIAPGDSLRYITVKVPKG
jgi:mannose-6-phosphate isomerase-like protein (cupin superfamily)